MTATVPTTTPTATIQIEPAQVERIQRLAAEQGISETELITRALNALVGQRERDADDHALLEEIFRSAENNGFPPRNPTPPLNLCHDEIVQVIGVPVKKFRRYGEEE